MAETLFDEDHRRALRRSLVSTGVAAATAAEIVDLACRAADRCREVLFETSRLARDPSASLSVLEIGSQLAIAVGVHTFERMEALSKQSGGNVARVGIKL